MKLPLKKLFGLLLLVASHIPPTSAQPSNTVVDYFFNNSATLWDLAELRIAQIIGEDENEATIVEFRGLDYDWQTGVPSVGFRVDLAPGWGPTSISRAEEVCQIMAKSVSSTLSLYHEDIWGNTGFTTEKMNENVEAISKQIRVKITIPQTNLSNMDPVTMKFGKNFEDPKVSGVVCETIGYGDAVSITRR